EGKGAPGRADDTHAARLERIAVLALVGIAKLVNGLLRVDALGNILVPVDYLNDRPQEQTVAMRAFPKVHGRPTRVQDGIGRPSARFHQDLGLSLDSV